MISQFKSKVGALAKKFGRFKKPKTLKMKAKSALAKSKKTVKNFVKKNPGKTYAAGVLGAAGVATSIGGQSRQNVMIEMQKIDKERRAGKKFTSSQIQKRLDKAKKSKREFTWI